MHARRLILSVLATVLGALAFSATPSLAGEVHVYSHISINTSARA